MGLETTLRRSLWCGEKLPWEPRTVLLYLTIFPRMTNWLPDEEGAQLRFEFEAKIKRLEAA